MKPRARSEWIVPAASTAVEPMRSVQDGLPAPVVVDQHHTRGLRVRLPEAEDVAQGSAAEAVDALVVVADDGDVAVRLGQQPNHLPLRVVRVLELVHQDVPIAAALLGEHGGMRPQEAEGQAHLVTEVEPIAAAHEALVGRVRARQLGVGGGGRRGGQRDPRDVRPPLVQQGQLQVLRAEVVPPLGDAVRLVDHEQAHAGGAHAVHEAR